MTAPHTEAPRATLTRLEAQGVRLCLTEDGSGLRVMGRGKPSPAVMEEVKAHKPALLAYLRGEGEGQRPEGAPTSSLSSPDAPSQSPKQSLSLDLPARAWSDGQPRTASGHLDMLAILARPKHCGNCARWQPLPEYGPHFGQCTAPARVWPTFDSPPLAIHAACACPLRGGRIWQPAAHFQQTGAEGAASKSGEGAA